MGTEFTGLELTDKAVRNGFDSSSILYKKHKFVCERFQAIQVGLCIFTWDEDEKLYYSRPYNFYVLPHTELEGESSEMLFDPGTCTFLQKYGFNWNFLFKNGISYKQLFKRDEVYAKCQRY